MPTFTQLLHVTRSGMLSRLEALDVASNNLANVNTVGYKRGRANFQELLSEQMEGGARIRATQNLMEQGGLQTTENPLDLAIEGTGFFQIALPDGRTAYTRDGQLFMDANRDLVTADGFPLVWTGQIPADAEDVFVNPDGTVMALQNGTWNEIGNIELARFPNSTGLQNYGQNLWLETDASGAAEVGAPRADGYGQILGSALESSNVSLAEEMTSLTTLQRGFEMSLKIFQQTDTMLSEAINMRK
ncbi:MAG: flagellar hook-basal body complex protein [Anaerolineales bacterium]|nr:flagellar hook-basal body complex protein [Anaerolineales bacterium]